MAEPPDFEQIAREYSDQWGRFSKQNPMQKDQVDVLTQALHQVWNARGAADAKAIEGELPPQYQVVTARAIKAQDR